ncbi:hypothetical protein Misp01_10570 [Microtetraspora sp. NBRC 13810]|nr:hypothetical protein Misp01_10570 [Microtetraspora sp. NBRC 13810]
MDGDRAGVLPEQAADHRAAGGRVQAGDEDDGNGHEVSLSQMKTVIAIMAYPRNPEGS